MLNHPIFSLSGEGHDDQFGNVSDPQGLYAGGALYGENVDREFQSIGIPIGTKSFVLVTLLLVPDSKGEVDIQANDPARMLLMDFNYFDPTTDDLDKAVYAYGVVYQTLLNMNLTPAGPNPADDDAVRAYIHRLITGLEHAECPKVRRMELPVQMDWSMVRVISAYTISLFIREIQGGIPKRPLI